MSVDGSSKEEFYKIFREDLYFKKKALMKYLPAHGLSIPPEKFYLHVIADKFMEQRGDQPIEAGFEMMMKCAVGYDIVNYSHNLGPDNKMLLDIAKTDKVYDLEPLTPEKLVGNWFSRTPVPVILVRGFMGAGKTDFAMLIGEVVRKWKYQIVTNIDTTDGTVVNSYKELKTTIESTEGNKLFIYDEAGSQGGARRSGSNLNVAINTFVTLARKRKTAIAYLTQLERQADVILKELANVVIDKVDPKTIKVEERLENKVIRYTIKNAPATDLYYDTYSVAYLSFEEGDKEKF